MAEVRVNTTGTLKLFDADDSHSAGIAAGTITADATLMTLNTADIDISVPIDVTGASTITTADNTDTLTLKSTDADGVSGPILALYRNSSSPADNDQCGRIKFIGRNDNSQDFDASYFTVSSVDVSDGSEDASMEWYVKTDGSDQLKLSMKPTETIFNEASADLDFRVETDDSTHGLFVDAGNNRIGIGTSSPDYTLHVRSMGSPSNDTFIDIEGNATDANCGIQFTDSAGNLQGRISYDTDDDNLQFMVNTSTERMRINSAGEVGIGLTSFDSQLTVQRSTAGGSYALFGIHSASSGVVRILRGSFNAQAPDDRTSVFITMGDSSATRFNVHADGDVDNHDNFYGQISDQRIKSNITDANSQWDDIKAIKFRNFERKDDIAQYGNGKKVQIGVVAQELETVSPGLVRETEPTADDIKMSSEFGTLYEDGDTIPEDKNIGDIKTTTGEKVKAVAYSVLYIKAVKALQEAMARIETLETKVKALEDA